MSAACPDPGLLIELVVAALAPDAAARVETHVSSCASCRAAVEQLEADANAADAPEAVETLRLRGPRPAPAPERFVLGGELGRGGMARIVVARDPRLDREVALKIATERSRSAELRLIREATIAARLAHPAVLPIYERGRLPTGEAYVAMRRAPGRSLERALRGEPTLAGRLAYLPHVLAAADALGHAHARRLLHRDVTPNNIMVDRFGDTQLIDWGLAKELGRGERPDGAAASRDPLVTHAGAVMGTPPYMAPEQARGEVVDARADVYALGAVLYRLVAGALPYDGDSDAVLAAVRAGPPPAVTTRVAAVPAELAAIIARAMARDRAERYPTATVLAADLRRFVEGRMVEAYRYPPGVRVARWLRRHRVSVAAAVLAAIAVAALGGLELGAMIAARDRAVAAERASDRLLWYVARDLRQRLASVGKLALLEDVLDAVEAHAARGGGDPAERAARRGEVLVSRALIATHRGRPADATAACAELRALSHSAEPAWRERRATCELELGGIALDHGDRAAAQAAYERGLAEAIAAEATGANPWSNTPARPLERLGSMLTYVAPRQALAYFAAAAAFAATAAARSPGDALVARDRLAIAVKIADALDSLGEAAAAADALAEGARVGRPWLAGATRDADAQRDQAILDQRRALLHAGLGRADALALLDRAHAGWLALAARDPADLARQEDLLLSWSQVAQVVVARDPRRAIAANRAGAAIAVRLVAAEPGNTRWREDLCQVKLGLGDAGLALHDEAISREGYAGAAEVADALLARGDDAKWLGLRVMARYGLAWTAYNAHAPRPTLRTSYLAWLAATEAAAARPDGARWDSFLVEAYASLADLDAADGDHRAATARLAQADAALARIGAAGGLPAAKRWLLDYLGSVRSTVARSRR